MNLPFRPNQIKTNTTYNTLFFFVLTIGLLILGYRVISSYISIIFFAFLISFLIRPFYLYFFKLFRRKSKIATSFTVFVIFLLLFLVVVSFLLLVFNQVVSLRTDIDWLIDSNIRYFQNYQDTIDSINLRIFEITGNSNAITIDQISSTLVDVSKNLLGRFQSFFTSIFSTSINLIANTILFVILLFSFIPNQPKIIQYIKRLSPLSDDVDTRIINKFMAMNVSMLKGTLLIAIVQGTLGGIVLWILGMPYAFFLGFLGVILSIIPLGSGILHIPIGISQILIGNVVQGVIILLVHFIITVNIDNVLRPALVSEDAKVPEVLVLIGAFGGIEAFGPIGLITGPALIAVILTVLDTYLSDYKQ